MREKQLLKMLRETNPLLLSQFNLNRHERRQLVALARIDKENQRLQAGKKD